MPAACLGFASLLAAAGVAAAAPAITQRATAGEFVIEPPTLHALGFEWYVKGDDDRNAVVAVSYRKRGEAAWKEAQPLVRLNKERNSPSVFTGLRDAWLKGVCFDYFGSEICLPI
jgi:hypothetical protein